MEKRKCYKCKIDKPLNKDFFSKDSIDKLGFQKACKDCQKKRNSEYRADKKEYFDNKNKEHYNKDNNKERYQKYKTSFLERRDKYRTSIRGRMYDLLESARGRAKNKSLSIDIDLDFLISLYEIQQGKCKLTNLEFKLERNENKKREVNPYSPSIDRIDSKKGYTKENVRLVCTIVNLSLNNFGESIFKIMCQAYINNSKSKGENL